jgi:uncharacterized membrane protein YfcA
MAATGILGGILGRKFNRHLGPRGAERLFLGVNILILCICAYNFIKFIG